MGGEEKEEETGGGSGKNTMEKDLVGQLIEGWKIGKCLGAGAFGIVFACDKQEEKAVVKVALHESKSFEWDFIAMKNIIEPGMGEDRWSNIVRSLGSGKAGLRFRTEQDEWVKEEISYVLMEFLPGSIVSACAEDPRTVKSFGIQMLRGIYDFNQVGMIHRDIKPENIGGTEDVRHAVVYDLGMARSVFGKNADFRIPRSRMVLRGTFDWASLHAESGRDQSLVDDMWGWLYTLHEWANVESNTPQVWVYYEKWSILRWFMKSALCPARITYNNCPYGIYKSSLYLRTLGRRDIPNYFFLASLFYHGDKKNPQKVFRINTDKLGPIILANKKMDELFS